MNSRERLYVKPLLTYKDLETNKHIIYKDNRNKSGIYRLNNLITNSSYIGSSINLNRRLGNYFSIKFLNNKLLKGKSKISSSLLEYGYSNFSLDILEYCDLDKIIEREQYYIDTCNSDLNIRKIVSSNIKFKVSIL